MTSAMNIIIWLYGILTKSISNVIKAIKASGNVSEGIFAILKIFMGIALFGVVLMIIYQAIRDHEKISVKPFSVSEAMQQKHKAAGSIVANLIKQDLAKERSKVDGILTTDAEGTAFDSGASSNFKISNDTNFFNGVNIKLPGTAVTINDIVDFISVLFGRQTITGSIYEDSGNLYLQVEINGKILTAHEPLPDEGGASLNIKTIESMSKKASKSILQLTSEKYQLYYYCLSGKKEEFSPRFENKEYSELSEYCKRYIEHDGTSDIQALESDIEQQKKTLQTASGMKRFVINLLSSKLSDASEKLIKAVSLSPNTKKQSPSLAEQVQQIMQHEITQKNMGGGFSIKQNKPVSINQMKIDERLRHSELIKLRKDCLTQKEFDASVSNQHEGEASDEYNKGNYKQATDLYKQAINANCDNPYAWANLGILLSDLDNKENFNAIEGVVALQRATEIKESAGWMWHSLCVAQMYVEDKDLERSLELNACQKARQVEPGKQLIYDKLFYTAIADKYKQLGKYEKAFNNYDKVLSIDPKRTCRFKSVIDKMQSIREKIGVDKTKEAICNRLKESYPVEESAQICEEALIAYEEQC